jgi:hypothetical protein
VGGLAALADTIRTLAPPYRVQGELMRLAVWERSDNTIVWHLIHVLEKLERGT